VFIWRLKFFGMKKRPPTFKKVMTKAFREYLDSFMKIFLNNYTTYTDMKIHLQKFSLCFGKCKEYNNSLNPKKCVFMVFSRIIFGFIVSKEVNYLIQRKYN